jgi:hypothetical protein
VAGWQPQFHHFRQYASQFRQSLVVLPRELRSGRNVGDYQQTEFQSLLDRSGAAAANLRSPQTNPGTGIPDGSGQIVGWARPIASGYVLRFRFVQKVRLAGMIFDRVSVCYR